MIELKKIESVEEYDLLKKEGVSIFYFSAAWLNFKEMEENIKKIAKENEKTYLVDIESFQEIAIKEGLVQFPSTLYFKNNNLEKSIRGFEKYENMIGFYKELL